MGPADYTDFRALPAWVSAVILGSVAALFFCTFVYIYYIKAREGRVTDAHPRAKQTVVTFAPGC